MTAPEGQGVTFVELFFDLVFVYALTEITGLTHGRLDWTGVAQAALVFWLVWWAWTQFTWALNAADTTHVHIRAGTLAATAVAFFMAISVGGALDDGGGLAFVVPYVAVRLIGLGLYWRVAATDAAWFSAVRVFSLVSLAGMATAIIGGAADPDARPWWWLATIVLDIGAAGVGGRQAGWSLGAAHFAERHGLFVIIALGESLIVAAIGAADAPRTTELVAVGVSVVAVVCLLWWTYFGRFKDELEHELHARLARGEAQFARDAYSILHFPLIAGIIGIAVGLEEMVAHPADPLALDAMAVFVGGLALFVGSAVPIWLRAGRGVAWVRVGFVVLVGVGAVVGALAGGGVAPVGVLVGAAVLLVGVIGLEAVGSGSRGLSGGEGGAG